MCSYECNVTIVTLNGWGLAMSRGKHTATDNDVVAALDTTM